MVDILLVEDYIELAILMKALLTQKGFSLCHVTSGEEALAWLKKHQVRMVLLDIMLDGLDGFAVCKSIREKGDIPIFILSAKADKADKLLGFELGADDYIEKPVDIDILSAKINAILSRKPSQFLYTKTLKIDVEAHKAYLHDHLLDLNVKEFELLYLLVQNQGKTLHKSYLFDQIWGDSFSEEQTLTVHIKMLRSKIEEDSRHPKKIHTVWGVGYRYEEV